MTARRSSTLVGDPLTDLVESKAVEQGLDLGGGGAAELQALERALDPRHVGGDRGELPRQESDVAAGGELGVERLGAADGRKPGELVQPLVELFQVAETGQQLGRRLGA